MNENALSKKQRTAETVLDYWYTMEFLSQDPLPKLSYEERRKNEEAVKTSAEKMDTGTNDTAKADVKVLKLITPVEENTYFLELAASEARRHGMSRWGNITIFAGKIMRERCIQIISKKLQEDDKRPEMNHDEIACFSIQLSPSGSYIEKTFFLSPMIWAVSHLEEGKGKSLAQCLSQQAYREEVEVFENRLKNYSLGNSGEPLDSVRTEEIKAAISKQIAGIYQEIYSEYLKEDFEMECKYSCIMLYQVFKNEDAREKYEDDDYQGLGRNFFAEDLKLVLSGIQTKGFVYDNLMQKSMIDYIIGPYADFYPEEKLFSFCDRFDLEHPAHGDEKGDGLRQVFANILDVQNAPVGKWPSRFMPALMQQVAVNLAVSGKTEQGLIFSVNGPPGTGKTTLLKEIIVDHIIKKAMLLSEYEKPDDAFDQCCFLYGEKKNNGYSRWYPKYYRLKNDRINDFGILITSCNNAAVENITKELPLEKGITDSLTALSSDSQLVKEQLEEVKQLFTTVASEQYEEIYTSDAEKKGEYKDIYFTEYAKGLLDNDGAWGLISAALGKKSNINRFYQNVLRHLDADFYRNDKIEVRLEQYREIRNRFKEQCIKVEKLQKELVENCRNEENIRRIGKARKEKIQGLYQENEHKTILLNEWEQQEKALKKQVEPLIEGQISKERKLALAGVKVEKAREAFADADREYEEKLKQAVETRESIHFLGRLFHKNDTRIKNELADKYAQEARVLKQRADERNRLLKADQADFDRLAKEKDDLRRELGGLAVDLEALIQKMEEIRKSIEANNKEVINCKQALTAEMDSYKKRLKEKIEAADDSNRFIPLDDGFMNQFLSADGKESTSAQVSNPWLTNCYNREREKLFYLSLQVSKSFILSSRFCFRNYRNLALLWQETKEDNETVSFHPEDRKACFGPLLQTLFLLVPVISTTFASVGSFLRDIKNPDVLGTLIVDEAGQAPPQMAIGALYRSRRAIIVGDPKQVEPVVTDDLQLLKKAYREDVYKPYKSKKVSVQQFADLINPYGTYMENDKNEKEWLGCPLVVHRRCISPMYDISNRISYNNTMKQQTGTLSGEKEEMLCYSGSRWINVKGREKGNKNHFVEAQAKRAAEILEIAFSKSDSPSLFIITPFTTVKYGLIQYLEGRLKSNDASVLCQKRSSVKAWMYHNIGTVHTFQGKEANEVVFLLGCDTSKGAAGAIRWVNANIVNVAVTRAKYRLYVIGDENAWKESQYVSRAKSIIDLYALKELSGIANGNQEESQEEKQKRVLTFCSQLPTAESVSMEQAEDEMGGTEYLFEPEIFLSELKSGELLLKEITDEQLKGYGFTRKSFQNLNPCVRENVEWGIKLYSMFKKLKKQYDIEELDASCCAILFCKAIELQIKECFYEGFKKQFPEYRIKGQGKGSIPMREAKKIELMLGAFCNVLHVDNHKRKLAEIMAAIKQSQYDISWWSQFDSQLDECRKLRNDCCHCDKFTWKQMNRLLVLMFMRNQRNESPVMDGLVRDSEVGRKLVDSSAD
ncbi:AAA domain-containing protein [Lachnospiraceae bacterium 54-53]